MILIPLLIGAALVGIAVFWKELISWMQRAINKVKQIISGALEGAKTFIVKMTDGIKNIAKYYSKNQLTNEYEETVTKKVVNENDVPEELRNRISMHINVEVDTTVELLGKLSA